MFHCITAVRRGSLLLVNLLLGAAALVAVPLVAGPTAVAASAPHSVEQRAPRGPPPGAPRPPPRGAGRGAG